MIITIINAMFLKLIILSDIMIMSSYTSYKVSRIWLNGTKSDQFQIVDMGMNRV